MATFITSRLTGSINIMINTSTGYWKYNHNGVDSGVLNQSSTVTANMIVVPVVNSNGEFTIISCDSLGNNSGDVTHLDLNNNSLTSFDGTGLSGLTILGLDNNQLTSFDGTGLTVLYRLYLRNNTLTSVDNFVFPTSLTNLNLDNNQLTSIDVSILPTSITQLSLSTNLFTSFNISELVNLVVLNLYDNQLTSFNGTGLTNLTQLSLTNNSLTSFDGIGLTGLTTLGLENNQLTSFDGTGLTNLTQLFLDYNPLTSFNGGDMSLISSLSFGNWGITSLTGFTGGNMTALTELYLENNQLTSFDGGNMTGLIYLYLSNNQIISFDGSGLTSLGSLTLTNNSLTSIDNFIFPVNLNVLFLNNNQLTGFTGTGLSTLSELYLGDNLLTSFDGGNMTGLTYLELQGNPLTSFNGGDMSLMPYLNFKGQWSIHTLQSFDGGNMTGLTYLELQGNPLTSFNGIGLTSLTELTLNDLQLTSIDNFIFPLNLSSLDLTNNLLTSFTGTGLTSLTTLILSNNLLTSFYGTGLSGLINLHLTNNPLTPSANNSILSQLSQNGLSSGYFEASNGRTSTSNSDYDSLLNLGWSFTGLDLVTTPTTNSCLNIISIDQWGVLRLGDTNNQFVNCSNLTLRGVSDALDLTGTTKLYYMFSNCTSLTTIRNINLWDVSSVTDMNGMFSNATSFNDNIGQLDTTTGGLWDVSKVETMEFMFWNATSFNKSLNDWNISSVTNMSNFMLGKTTADYSYYDSLLNAWSKLTLQSLNSKGGPISLDMGTIQYTSAGETARQSIIDTYGWVINDGGLLVETTTTTTTEAPTTTTTTTVAQSLSFDPTPSAYVDSLTTIIRTDVDKNGNTFENLDFEISINNLAVKAYSEGQPETEGSTFTNKLYAVSDSPGVGSWPQYLDGVLFESYMGKITIENYTFICNSLSPVAMGGFVSFDIGQPILTGVYTLEIRCYSDLDGTYTVIESRTATLGGVTTTTTTEAPTTTTTTTVTYPTFDSTPSTYIDSLTTTVTDHIDEKDGSSYQMMNINIVMSDPEFWPGILGLIQLVDSNGNLKFDQINIINGTLVYDISFNPALLSGINTIELYESNYWSDTDNDGQVDFYHGQSAIESRSVDFG